ncbi:tripartite motif-containing protein 16-like [Anabas testudineus]|uniref:tripartite motif-containing protein 16-like n=1 Tax=Anabas testudineus TaxID=64144 RepID=UPI000E46045D|nr:tripartite motif-containing protein 16-like [Anabas testudineus]
MAQKGAPLDRESSSCLICLDVLKDPVTVPCGHSYCLNCINRFWDEEDQNKRHSCPQCRQMEAAPAGLCYAGPEDVTCDVCSSRKRKALKSCLMCLASYCEEHLQLHYDSAPLKKHKLVEPSNKLQENICSRHHEVMKMFCRTDQQCICYLCSVEEHKGHDTVSAAAERTEKQRELEGSRQKLQERIQDREKEVKLLQREVEAINHSAGKTVEESEKIFTDLIRLMEKRRSEVKQQIRSQQETEVSLIRKLQQKLEQEITDLKRTDAELEQLSHTEDHSQFLQNHPSVSELSEDTDSSSINVRPVRFFEDVTAAVTELRDVLEDILRQTWRNISLTVTELDVLRSEPEPQSRAEFLRYSRDIRLDPNTAHTTLSLTEGNRKATVMNQPQSYSSHPDRFTVYTQVLSRERLSARSYWEVEWRGTRVHVAVAYRKISRAGNDSGFGCNDQSWALDCDQNTFSFYYENIQTPVFGRPSSRIGVYLDPRAGVLSFYSVSGTMTLLHRVQTTFTEPLHAGLWLPYSPGDTAEFCKLK